MAGDEWEIFQTDEVAAWMEDLRRTDPQAAEKVEAAVDVLSEHGPTLGRPLVDTPHSVEARQLEGTTSEADDDSRPVRLRSLAVSHPAGRRG